MFYLSSLTKDLCVDPENLSSDIKSLISSKIKEIEGTVIGNYGYIISIVEFSQVSKGKIDNETGKVNYKINYKAITFKPFVNEILKAYPFFINEHGFFCKVGHLQIFVSQHMMKDWNYISENNEWHKEGKIVRVNNVMLLKIIAFRINSNEITALAEIDEQN